MSTTQSHFGNRRYLVIEEALRVSSHITNNLNIEKLGVLSCNYMSVSLLFIIRIVARFFLSSRLYEEKVQVTPPPICLDLSINNISSLRWMR